MNKTTILIFIVLLCCRCTTGQNLGEFPEKINVIVKDREHNIVKNRTVSLMAAYYRVMSLKEDYLEYYRVTTNMQGEATVIRGTGYKREGSYDTIQKLLNGHNYANMHLFLLDDKEYAIQELGIFQPEWNKKLLAAKYEQEDPGSRQEVVENIVEPPVPAPVAPSGPDELPDSNNVKSKSPLAASPENWKLVEFVGINKKVTQHVVTSPVKGQYEKVISGLKIYSLPQSYSVVNKHEIDFDGRTIYFKWKAETYDHWSEMSGRLFYKETDDKQVLLSNYENLFFMRFNRNSKYGFNYKNRDWIYTRITFKDHDCRSYIATGNYDDKGGTLVLQDRKSYISAKGYFGFRMDDLANTTNAWVIIGEVQIK